MLKTCSVNRHGDHTIAAAAPSAVSETSPTSDVKPGPKTVFWFDRTSGRLGRCSTWDTYRDQNCAQSVAPVHGLWAEASFEKLLLMRKLYRNKSGLGAVVGLGVSCLGAAGSFQSGCYRPSVRGAMVCLPPTASQVDSE